MSVHASRCWNLAQSVLRAVQGSNSELLTPSWAICRWYASQHCLRLRASVENVGAKLTPWGAPQRSLVLRCTPLLFVCYSNARQPLAMPTASWLAHAADCVFVVRCAADVSWSGRRARPEPWPRHCSTLTRQRLDKARQWLDTMLDTLTLFLLSSCSRVVKHSLDTRSTPPRHSTLARHHSITLDTSPHL